MARLSTAKCMSQLHQETIHVATTHSAPPLPATHRNIALESSVWPRGLAAAFKARDLTLGCPDGAHVCSDIDTRACCPNGSYCEQGVIADITTVGCVATGSSATTSGFAPASTTIESFTELLSTPSPSFSSSAMGAATSASSIAPTSQTPSGLTSSTITSSFPSSAMAATTSSVAPTGGGSESNLSKGGEIGSIVGGGVAVLGILLTIWFKWKKRRERRAKVLQVQGEAYRLNQLGGNRS